MAEAGSAGASSAVASPLRIKKANPIAITARIWLRSNRLFLSFILSANSGGWLSKGASVGAGNGFAEIYWQMQSTCRGDGTAIQKSGRIQPTMHKLFSRCYSIPVNFLSKQSHNFM